MTLQEELKMHRPFVDLEEETIVALLATKARVEEILNKIFEQQGLTRPQFNILRILRGAQPERLSCSAINERLVEKNPDITRLLDRLEDAGFVERARGKEDRRQVFATITKQGLSLLKLVDQDILNVEKKIMSCISKQEMKDLNRLLEKIRDHIRSFQE